VDLTGDALVANNYAHAKGGGIFDSALANTQGVNATNATVTGNNAAISGGGIYVTAGTVNVLDSTISNNVASRFSGGGIENVDTQGGTVVTNSTIGGNVAGVHGGGISSAAPVAINNSTIALNSLYDSFDFHQYASGAGVFAKSTFQIDNTIVAGNFDQATGAQLDIRGTATGSNDLIAGAGSSGGLANGVNSDIVGLNGTGTRPLLTIINTNLVNNGGPTDTFALALDSAAHNAGNSALNPASVGNYDQRGPGFPRTMNGLMDIGAVEEG
jgi:hypothetical protein